MFGLRENKKMVERPENEPKFSMKNKTDRTIFIIVLSGLLIATALLIGFILLYIFVLR